MTWVAYQLNKRQWVLLFSKTFFFFFFFFFEYFQSSHHFSSHTFSSTQRCSVMGLSSVCRGVVGAAAAVSVCCVVRAYRARTPSQRVVVVTDVAKDIDDTLSLIYLSALARRGAVSLIGVTTCGGSTEERATVASHLLERLLPEALRPSVIPGFATQLNGDAVENHDVLTHPIEGNLASSGTAVDALFDWTQSGPCTVICLGPLTDIALLLRKHPQASFADTTFLIQGQANADGTPNAEAYNLRCDMPAAQYCFNFFREHNVAVLLLGKHAAYQAPITQQHIEALDGGRLPWSLQDLVTATLIEFVGDKASTDILQRAYDVDRGALVVEAARSGVSMGTAIWSTFPHVTVPYDPLCCMLLGMVHGSRLQAQSAGLLDAAERLVWANGSPSSFVAVGNTASSARIDAVSVLDTLFAECRSALH